MTQFETLAIETAVNYVVAEIGCSQLEAVTKLQATCARNGDEAMLEKLSEFKRPLIEASA